MNCSSRRRRALLAAAGGAMLTPWFARGLMAQLQVDVGRGRVEPIPIAISPFAGDPIGVQIADVITNDLDSSGLFRTIDRAAYIQSPEELRELPRFADWRQINAQALVSGTVGNAGGNLVIEFRLWDIFAGQQLTGVRFDGPQSLWRRLAHKVADAIYTRLTGERGYFDTRIAYIAESGPGQQRVKRLAIMDQDGANHSFLSDGRDRVITPRFSPDARRLAYAAWRNGALGVYIRDIAAGRDVLAADLPGGVFSPRFSPDGGTLLVTSASAGNSDIYAIDVGSRRARRVTDSSAIDTSPSFAPEGQRIVFNSDRAGGPQLYVTGVGGAGGAQRISFGSGRYGDPVWSPRGDLIAFTRQQSGQLFIGVMRPDGSDERSLTRSPADKSPAWTPNGRVVIFSRQDRSGRTRLFSIDITGYNERVVPTPLDASDPDWSPLLP